MPRVKLPRATMTSKAMTRRAARSRTSIVRSRWSQGRREFRLVQAADPEVRVEIVVRVVEIVVAAVVVVVRVVRVAGRRRAVERLRVAGIAKLPVRVVRRVMLRHGPLSCSRGDR